MVFFKKPYVVRRYSKPVYVHGHLSSSYEDLKILMDVQTMEDTVKTELDGAKYAAPQTNMTAVAAQKAIQSESCCLNLTRRP